MIVRLQQLYMLYLNGLITQIYHFIKLIHNKSTLQNIKIDDVLLNTTLNGILICKECRRKIEITFYDINDEIMTTTRCGILICKYARDCWNDIIKYQIRPPR